MELPKIPEREINRESNPRRGKFSIIFEFFPMEIPKNKSNMYKVNIKSLFENFTIFSLFLSKNPNTLPISIARSIFIMRKNYITKFF